MHELARGSRYWRKACIEKIVDCLSLFALFENSLVFSVVFGLPIVSVSLPFLSFHFLLRQEGLNVVHVVSLQIDNQLSVKKN